MLQASVNNMTNINELCVQLNLFLKLHVRSYMYMMMYIHVHKLLIQYNMYGCFGVEVNTKHLTWATAALVQS